MCIINMQFNIANIIVDLENNNHNVVRVIVASFKYRDT